MVYLRCLGSVFLSGCFILTAADVLLVIEPPSLVVEYGAEASAYCFTNHTHEGIGWEASQGAVDIMEGVQNLTWRVKKLTQWDIRPICFINYKHEQSAKQYDLRLPVTVYKIPDRVSIDFQNHTGPVIEGRNYTLRCNIYNVAPGRNISVEFNKQDAVQENMQFDKTTKTPVDISVDLPIQPSRSDDGSEYWCRAELKLGPEGPQPSPVAKSSPLRITVHYEPKFFNHVEIINQMDGEIVLNCTVTANPPPVYSWNSKHLQGEFKTPMLSLNSTTSGNYTCTASNQHGAAQKLFIIQEKPKGGGVFWYAFWIAVAILILVGLGVFLVVKFVIPKCR